MAGGCYVGLRSASRINAHQITNSIGLSSHVPARSEPPGTRTVVPRCFTVVKPIAPAATR
jgi:hypothetical protein